MVEVVDRYGGLIWSIASAVGIAPADAEDVVHEVFLSIWENAHRFDPALGAEASFVGMIARRRMIDHKRRTARRARLLERHARSLAEEITTQEGEATRAEELARVEEAMVSLSIPQRHVLRLALHESLTHEEIASSTGMPLGTVKTHVRRGLIRLRAALGLAVHGDGVREVDRR